MVAPQIGALDGGEVAVSQVVGGSPPGAEGIAVACVGVAGVRAVGSQSGVVPPPRVPGDPGPRQVDAGLQQLRKRPPDITPVVWPMVQRLPWKFIVLLMNLGK